MLDEEKEFYRCMQEFYPPKLSDKDFHLVVNEEWEMCAIEWEKIQTQQQFLDKRDKELRIKLIEMAEAMGKKNLTGGGVKVCKSTRKGNIQYDKVPELHKVDLEKHRGAIVEFWRFTRD
jgi:hypothetical protein